MDAVHRLRDVVLALHLQASHFAHANDLHITDLRAIIELLDAERAGTVATPTWLGECLRLNSASVTALVDRLERMGHVQRAPHPTDRRRVRLTITDSAKQVGTAFFGPLIGHVLGTMESFNAHDRATITRFLAALATRLTLSELQPDSAP
jgi:DNA-binding MarR family transcriptional regulator